MTTPDRHLLDEQIAYYRARAPEYDATSTPDGDPFAVHAATIRTELAAQARWGRVLEIAAGTGQWTGLLADLADHLLVTDASPEMLALARSKVGTRPHVRWQVADAVALEPSGSVDTVFFGFFLSHVPAAWFEPFWNRLRGVLAPGGRAVFVDEGPHGGWREDWIDRPGGIVQRSLRDGSTHRAVKVLWAAEDLQARLSAIGWDASVRRVGPFYWGSAHPR